VKTCPGRVMSTRTQGGGGTKGRQGTSRATTCRSRWEGSLDHLAQPHRSCCRRVGHNQLPLGLHQLLPSRPLERSSFRGRLAARPNAAARSWHSAAARRLGKFALFFRGITAFEMFRWAPAITDRQTVLAFSLERKGKLQNEAGVGYPQCAVRYVHKCPH
jgi:hypothetical protein